LFLNRIFQMLWGMFKSIKLEVKKSKKKKAEARDKIVAEDLRGAGEDSVNLPERSSDSGRVERNSESGPVVEDRNAIRKETREDYVVNKSENYVLPGDVPEGEMYRVKKQSPPVQKKKSPSNALGYSKKNLPSAVKRRLDAQSRTVKGGKIRGPQVSNKNISPRRKGKRFNR